MPSGKKSESVKDALSRAESIAQQSGKAQNLPYDVSKPAKAQNLPYDISKPAKITNLSNKISKLAPPQVIRTTVNMKSSPMTTKRK